MHSIVTIIVEELIVQDILIVIVVYLTLNADGVEIVVESWKSAYKETKTSKVFFNIFFLILNTNINILNILYILGCPFWFHVSGE